MLRTCTCDGRHVVLLVWLLSLVAGWVLVGRIVPEPYMDEIFHVSQTQQYWAGNWKHWDDKITTPPGLYLLGWLSCWCARTLGILEANVCDTQTLRVVNVVGAIACVALFLRIRKKHTCKDDKRCNKNELVHAVNLAIYPFHFFYCLVYYTDVWSTAFVLLAYSYGVDGNYWLSAMFGACSLLMRQTNILWFSFTTAVSMRRFLKNHTQSRRNKVTKSDLSSPLEELKLLSFLAWRKKRRILYFFFPHVLLFGSFVAFLYLNGGVVLGDRLAHTVSFHPMQLLYFALVFSTTRFFRCLKILAVELKHILTFAKRKPLSCTLILGGVTLALCFVIKEFTIYHPFLLADNRHFTFYFRRKILDGLPSGKYLMLPLYLISLIHFLGEWQRSKLPGLEKIAWLVTTVLSVVPSPLVELRYFNLPVIFITLLFSPAKGGADLWLFVQYLFVNMIVVFVFLFLPFSWPDGSTARFIW
mmetsp:Transcript_4387/g.27961  ORF Transcript_4387/g.27961 Transcript_4387/m.27961 type:complete len:471 (-) Transcript_4387:2082-3494(-)